MPNADVRISEFTYDGFGRRVGIVEKLNGSVTDDRHFIWDGLSIVEEWDTTGASPSVGKRFFTHGEQRGAAEYLFLRDHLGSVREVLHTTGGQGELMAYDYTPYGERTVAHQGIQGAPEFDFGYTGHFTHLETGLVLAPYRAYMPETGRWVSRDPIRENGGINLYAYVEGNVLNLVDPLGLAGGGPDYGRIYGLIDLLADVIYGTRPGKLAEEEALLALTEKNNITLRNLGQPPIPYDQIPADIEALLDFTLDGAIAIGSGGAGGTRGCINAAKDELKGLGTDILFDSIMKKVDENTQSILDATKDADGLKGACGDAVEFIRIIIFDDGISSEIVPDQAYEVDL